MEVAGVSNIPIGSEIITAGRASSSQSAKRKCAECLPYQPNYIGNYKMPLIAGGSSGQNAMLQCDDIESSQVQFGWAQFGKVHIPYIYRQQEKYCSVRILDAKLLALYFNSLHADVYTVCPPVSSYYVTQAEVRLLNEINVMHCDGGFGLDAFKLTDRVVRLSEASKFIEYLEFCFGKFVTSSTAASEPCGFVCIKKQSVVPYTLYNGKRLVPIFYFEFEDCNRDEFPTVLLQGWDMVYLKFLFRVQGIRSELYSGETLAVTPLTSVISQFPNGTPLEDHWPSTFDTNRLIAKGGNVNISFVWTRSPPSPLKTGGASVSGNRNSKITPQPSANGTARNVQYKLPMQRAPKMAQQNIPAIWYCPQLMQSPQNNPENVSPLLVQSAETQDMIPQRVRAVSYLTTAAALKRKHEQAQQQAAAAAAAAAGRVAKASIQPK